MKVYEAKRIKKQSCLAKVNNSLNLIRIYYLDEVDTLDDVDIDDFFLIGYFYSPSACVYLVSNVTSSIHVQ